MDPSHDGLRYKVVRAKYRWLRLLTHVPRPGADIGEELGVTSSRTIRRNLNGLADLGLAIKDADGYRLHPQWRETLDALARTHGTHGHHQRDIDQLANLRARRECDRQAMTDAEAIQVHDGRYVDARTGEVLPGRVWKASRQTPDQSQAG